mmetsp:Transcript_37973/g.117349  ORF Transcript_37973/g.117349 Transcript_37973/m.117349 type:complete len:294 (-) Transcript_37973:704-1585(-)
MCSCCFAESRWTLILARAAVRFFLRASMSRRRPSRSEKRSMSWVCSSMRVAMVASSVVIFCSRNLTFSKSSFFSSSCFCRRSKVALASLSCPSRCPSSAPICSMLSAAFSLGICALSCCLREMCSSRTVMTPSRFSILTSSSFSRSLNVSMNSVISRSRSCSSWNLRALSPEYSLRSSSKAATRPCVSWIESRISAVCRCSTSMSCDVALAFCTSCCRSSSMEMAHSRCISSRCCRLLMISSIIAAARFLSGSCARVMFSESILVSCARISCCIDATWSETRYASSRAERYCA